MTDCRLHVVTQDNHCKYLEGEDGWNAVFEEAFHAFRWPYFHSQPCTDASADEDEHQPRVFFPMAFRLTAGKGDAVQTINQERQYVD